MLIDLARDRLAQLSADVAIVGAGAAGITLARRLLAHGHSVLLLESGGADYERTTADLNAGENVGQPYYPLDHARLRFFGGATTIWGGRCAELDAIDFERRDWVPHSGWPFAREELVPWYREARAVFGLTADAPDARVLRAAGVPLPGFAGQELATPLWSFDPDPDRFTFARAEDLVWHPRCTVVLHANVTQIRAVPSGTAVDWLEVRAPGGARVPVRARCHVLAAGGIENPRLLLASRTVHAEGLGNQHDLVGRFFMEHPHARGGRIVSAHTWQLLHAFRRHRLASGAVAPLIAPSAGLQAREGILNTSLAIGARRPAAAAQPVLMRAYLRAKHELDPRRLTRSVWRCGKQLVNRVQEVTDPARPWLLHRLGGVDVALVVRAEQSPNPASRVTLDTACDAHGMPRVRLDWRTQRQDIDSVRVLVEALGRETRRLGLGEVQPSAWLSDPAAGWQTDALISAHPIGGYHHIGTTRMAASPRQGVTDAQGRVHGIDNLYVAGSSLFPTSGWANPTLTIVALALRAADHIASRWSPG